uniref:Endonuclease/exonuclease/phosphatase family domain-containing protein 1 n=1 Tax=Strigamia maritima TaxID=126957 RepID=T1ISV2_STRMM
MGQNSSRHSVASSLRGRKSHKPFRKRGHSDLSAAFNMIDVDLSHDQQLNINLATEEELMTLPGISRLIAKNIIEYKQTIGSFRKVEDLALVSGVGASKLEQLRPEICVVTKRKPNASLTSSLNGSTESLTSSVTSMNKSVKMPCHKVINVNKANVFQLMSIRGIDQELAANIVHYREKKGHFKSLDNLVKVKGFSIGHLGFLRHSLSIDMNSNAVEVISHTPQRTPQIIHNQRSLHHRSLRTTLPKLNSTLFDKNELYELLSLKSSRPINEEVFAFRRNGKAALRLATWNLQNFTLDKVDNQGVREVICRTILENGIVACQELGDKEVLDKICAELTNPCITKVQQWSGHRGTWECITSEAMGQLQGSSMEFGGFLYDTSKGIDFIESGLLRPLTNRENGNIPRRSFWVDKVDITIVCVHAPLPKLVKGDRNILAVDDLLKNLNSLKLNENVIVLGDFGLPPLEQGAELDFNPLRENYYTHIVPVGVYTNSNTNYTLAKHHDNIWISKFIRKFFTSHWGIVRQGLSHLAIPNGWTWGGSASDHCPIWAEFYVQLDDEDRSSSPLANGRIKEESTA